MATYREAGVNLESAEAAMSRIAPHIAATQTGGMVGRIGAFGGFFEVPQGFRRPILVSSVDGVGTKVKVAVRAKRHHTIGEDLVNHCVNDIAVCGATPLFFLDYFAAGTLDPGVFESVISGVARGCKAHGMPLIGGETAEMPDLYAPGEYDLAGTVVGIVEHDDILDGSRVAEGDVLIGLPSSGLHTNGYTLARYASFKGARAYSIDDKPPLLKGRTVGEELLQVHRSYLVPIRALCEAGLVHAFAHVTGGGIEGNTRRVVSSPLDLSVRYEAWTRPSVFDFIQRAAEVPEEDMRNTFNLGIGLVALVPPRNLNRAQALLSQCGERPVTIGSVHRHSTS